MAGEFRSQAGHGGRHVQQRGEIRRQRTYVPFSTDNILGLLATDVGIAPPESAFQVHH
jgi:hypothetical protein